MNICEVKNISKAYGDKIIFQNFSLTVSKGDYVCIAGNSGSGKSTLINLMGLLEAPDSGSINICGEINVKPNTRRAQKLLRHNIGFLFQNFALIDDKTVGYNLNIANVAKKSYKYDINAKIIQELNLNVALNQKVYKLSGGEQQRLALARLLIKDCDIIFADEPTGSLDINNRNLVLDILSKLNKAGKTIVMVSHDPYVIEQCKFVLKL